MIGKHGKALTLCLKTGTLLVSLSSGYGRAFAGSCISLGPGSYTCSGAAAPGDATVTRITPTPLAMTTLPEFGISTVDFAAFDLTAYGGLTFTDTNASVITGAIVGINARNLLSGALSITASGAVTGGFYGIRASNFFTNLTISAADVSGGTYGIVAYNFGSGALSITASGAVTGGFYGIRASNYTGTDLTISAADVSGGTTGIGADNSGSGALSITASGAVTGGVTGINAINSGTDLTISAADVSGGTDGILATNSGSGTLSITTTGLVTGGAGGYGIDANNNGGRPTTINVGPGSVVMGGIAGIAVSSSTGQGATINVYGQVSNLSGLATDLAITVGGGPATVNLHSGSVTTGIVSLGAGDDTVNLAGTLNGSARLNGGDDTFIQTGGSVLTGTADGGSGIDTLGFNDMGVIESSKYLNFENLAIFGGSTTLIGSWDFSGGTSTIYQGNLYVDGSLLTSNLVVEKGGLLGGHGNIYGDVTAFGTVSPGNSIGTLNVDGSVSFMPGSTYVVQLAASGDSDLLRENGPVSIDYARLTTSLERALYANGQSWQIIDASGGISGRFSSISTNFTSVTLDLQPVYHGDSLDLVIVRTPFESFGGTANEAAVGSALDELLPSAHSAMAGLLTVMDFDLDAAGISATLTGLNPEMYTAFPAAGLTVAGNFSELVALRQQEARDAAFFSENRRHGWNLWGRAFSDWLDREAENGVDSYTLDTGGVVFGMDRSVFSAVSAGLELGYSSSDLSRDVPGQGGEIDAKHIGVYAGSRLGGFYLEGSAGYTRLDNSAERLIATPLFNAQTAGSFDSDVWDGTLLGGYDFGFGKLRLGPVAAVNYRHSDQEGGRERGAGDFAVNIGSDTAESLTSTLGLRATGLFQRADWRFLPRVGVGLTHQYKDDPVRLTANFAGYPEANLTVAGAEPPENQVLASVGMSTEYGRNLSLYLDLSAAMASDQEDTLLTGGLEWKF